MPEFNIFNFMLSVLITVSVYTLPIVIYRYAISRRPIGRYKAKMITLFYGCFAFLAMSVIVHLLNGDGSAGGAIILWSYVNYRILIGGPDNRKATPLACNSDAPVNTDIASAEKNLLDAKDALKKARKEQRKNNSLGVPLWAFSCTVALLVIFFVAVTFFVARKGYDEGYIAADTEAQVNIEALRKNIRYYRDTATGLERELNSANSELNFWQQSAVICTTVGSKYHHYGCGHLENRSYYIYNIENAKYYGYTPCLDCCGQE